MENDQIFIKIPQSRNGDQEVRLSRPTDVFSTRAQTLRAAQEAGLSPGWECL